MTAGAPTLASANFGAVRRSAMGTFAANTDTAHPASAMAASAASPPALPRAEPAAMILLVAKVCLATRAPVYPKDPAADPRIAIRVIAPMVRAFQHRECAQRSGHAAASSDAPKPSAVEKIPSAISANPTSDRFAGAA